MAEGQPRRHIHPHPLRQHTQSPLLPGNFQQLLGVLVGAGLAYGVTRHLEALPSTFFTAVVLAGTSILSGRALEPWAWWGVLGAGCGGLLLRALGETWEAYATVFVVSCIARLAAIPILYRVRNTS